MINEIPGIAFDSSAVDGKVGKDKQNVRVDADDRGSHDEIAITSDFDTYSSASAAMTQTRCGFGHWRPVWLQTFHNAKCLLLCLILCSVAQSMVINGLVPVSITTLERRFHLTSVKSGFFASFYDVAVLLALLPVSHFGGKGHKPRWLGLGIFIMGVGSIVCALPQFLLAPLKQKQSNSGLCLSKISNATAVGCDEVVEYDETLVQLGFYLLLFGQLLHGFGAAPLYTLGVTLLDESVTQSDSPIYLGLFYGFSIFGPAIGFVVGGTLLKIYGDIDKGVETQLNDDDPLWYGAWWIGFLIAGCSAIVVSFPLFSFARELPEAKENRKEDVNQAHGRLPEHVGRKMKDLPKAVLELVKNPPFMCIIGMKSAEAFLMNGFVTFIAKMLENFFSLSSSDSSRLAGAVMVPGGLFGNLIGGFVVNRFKMRCRKMITMALTCQLVSMFFVLGFLIVCPESRFVGVNEPPTFRTSLIPGNLTDACNVDCQCSSFYNPVCHSSTQLVYYSPCHAGCRSEGKHLDEDENRKRWTNCDCVNGTMEDNTGDVVQGYCPLSCKLVTLFLVVCGCQIFMTFVAAMPVQQVELRCVSFQQRTLAVSFSWIFVRLLGTIPGPIVAGYTIDTSCILWQIDCDVQRACLRYNPWQMSHKILSLGLSLKAAICVFLLLAFCLYRPQTQAVVDKDLLNIEDVTTGEKIPIQVFAPLQDRNADELKDLIC